MQQHIPAADSELAECGLTREALDAILAEPAIPMSAAELEDLIEAYIEAGDEMNDAAQREEIAGRLAGTIAGPVALSLLEWAQAHMGEATADALRRAANPYGLAVSAWQSNYDRGLYGPTEDANGLVAVEEPKDLHRLTNAIAALSDAQAAHILNTLLAPYGNHEPYNPTDPYLKDGLTDHLRTCALLQGTDAALADLALGLTGFVSLS